MSLDWTLIPEIISERLITSGPPIGQRQNNLNIKNINDYDALKHVKYRNIYDTLKKKPTKPSHCSPLRILGKQLIFESANIASELYIHVAFPVLVIPTHSCWGKNSFIKEFPPIHAEAIKEFVRHAFATFYEM